MGAYTYSPNGHVAQGAASRTRCEVCAASLYTSCRNGHFVWLPQPMCPTCGATQEAGSQTWTDMSWTLPPAFFQLSLRSNEAKPNGPSSGGAALVGWPAMSGVPRSSAGISVRTTTVTALAPPRGELEAQS